MLFGIEIPKKVVDILKCNRIFYFQDDDFVVEEFLSFSALLCNFKCRLVCILFTMALYNPCSNMFLLHYKWFFIVYFVTYVIHR